MPVFVIPDEDALRAALDSGLVPPEIQSKAARFGVDESGALYVEPAVDVPRKVSKRLREAGISTTRKRSRLSDDVRCWAELLAPRPGPEPAPPLGEIMFVAIFRTLASPTRPRPGA